MSDKPTIDKPIVGAALVGAHEEPALPPIPRGLFDAIYKLPTSPQCRQPGLQKDCAKTCEPGPDNTHGENLLLLPGEEEYLRERFAERGVPWKWTHDAPVVVRLNQTCPYHEDRVCTIHDLRPFTCRSYPLRCHKIGTLSLSVYSAMGCPFKVDDTAKIAADQHHRQWIQAWKELMPFLPNKWWVAFIRACPAGMLHIADIVDPNEPGAPPQLVGAYANPDCPNCGGDGFTERGLCQCTASSHVRRAIMRDLHHHRRRFKS